MDPLGRHALLSVQSGGGSGGGGTLDTFYLDGELKKVRPLPKLKGLAVTSVAWSPSLRAASFRCGRREEGDAWEAAEHTVTVTEQGSARQCGAVVFRSGCPLLRDVGSAAHGGCPSCSVCLACCLALHVQAAAVAPLPRVLSVQFSMTHASIRTIHTIHTIPFLAMPCAVRAARHYWAPTAAPFTS